MITRTNIKLTLKIKCFNEKLNFTIYTFHYIYLATKHSAFFSFFLSLFLSRPSHNIVVKYPNFLQAGFENSFSVFGCMHLIIYLKLTLVNKLWNETMPKFSNCKTKLLFLFFIFYLQQIIILTYNLFIKQVKKCLNTFNLQKFHKLFKSNLYAFIFLLTNF